ncbi:MAG: DUF3054 domain-containing protein [Chloroflexi bacterium]|nr:DUF3054 domain-containing protein [Chloroflexota bacterium]
MRSMGSMHRSAHRTRRPLLLLLLGDALVVLLTSLAGFAQHGELMTAGVGRVAATAVPFAVAWFLTAPWLGCFDLDRMPRLSYLWRVPAAAVLAAPLGAVLRGLWLEAPVLPIFAVVMAAVLGAGMLVWRVLAARLLRLSIPAAG